MAPLPGIRALGGGCYNGRLLFYGTPHPFPLPPPPPTHWISAEEQQKCLALKILI